MSLQCPRCSFIATLRASRPRLQARHNRILSTPSIRTLTTTLPLSRDRKSRLNWEEHKQSKQRETESITADLLARISRLKPNQPLVINEDEVKFMKNVRKHYQETEGKVPKLNFKVDARQGATLQFPEVDKRRKDNVYDYVRGRAENQVEGAVGDLDRPVLLADRARNSQQREGSHITSRQREGESGTLNTAPRKMIYENQGSEFSERMPKPKGIIFENQVSTSTMREQLELEWRRKEKDHASAFKNGGNVDLIMEKLIENYSWQLGEDEDTNPGDFGGGAGYDEGVDMDPETYASRNSDLTPGSLVEVSYTDQSVPFLTVYLKSKSGNYSREAFVLTSQGSLQLAKADMSRFILPDYIPVELVNVLLTSIQQTGRLDPEAVQAITKHVREFSAKVHLLYPTYSTRVDRLYDELVKDNEGDETLKSRTISTTEVAKRLTEKTEPSPQDRYAAHLALLARRDLFAVMESWEEEPLWEVKSEESVQRTKNIEALIRQSIEDRDSKGGKMIQGFVEKAKKVIDFGRKARKEGKGVDEMEEKLDVEWSDEELELLKALEGAMEYRRGQTTTLKALYPHILGLLDRYGNDLLLDEQRLFDFLGEVGVCSPWEDSVLREPELGLPGHRANVETEDDGKLYEAIEKEEGSVEKLGLTDMMEGLRHDWADMPVYCIDDAGTKDIDDGVSLEEIKDSKDVWLHIHVANPTAFIPMDHWIGRIASKRTQTFYAPARNYPMIPLRLSVEKLGLAPDRPAMTFSVRLDGETGELKDKKIQASTVRNVKRVSYAYVNKLVGAKTVESVVLSNKPLPEKEEEPEPDLNEQDRKSLTTFYRLGWELFQQRVKKGCTEVAKQTSIDIRVDNGHGNEIHPGLSIKPVLDVYEPTITMRFEEMTRSKESFTSAGAVREAMTVAGEAAAIWSHERGMMQMYRQHAFKWQTEDEEKKWTSLLNKSKDKDGIVPIDFWKLYFPVGGSTLTPTMARHTALGLNGYIKVTSPLRRYADFVSHHIIQRQLLAEHEGFKGDREEMKKPMFTEEEVESFCKRIRQREKMISSADKALIRLWGIRLLKQLWEKQDPRLPAELEVEIISVAQHPAPASGEIKGLGLSGARVYMPSNITKQVKYGDIVKARPVPWHWSASSNNSQIVAMEYTDYVKTMVQTQKEFYARIGEGVRWERLGMSNETD